MMKNVPYPIFEKSPERIRSASGKSLAQITVEDMKNLCIDDLRISQDALQDQAAVASQNNRKSLAANFERAGEMTKMSSEEILEIYESLRPGRVKSPQKLLDLAESVRRKYSANHVALLIEEAAEAYERRSIFNKR